MSETRTQRRVQYTTPKGILRYPKITEPSYGSEDYPKPMGEYATEVVFKADSPEAKHLIQLLSPHYKEMQAWAAEEYAKLPIGTRKANEKKGIKGPTFNPLYRELYDKETEEPTGEIAFRFQADAAGEIKKGPRAGKKWTWRPLVFDAHKHRIVDVPDIWGGTVARIAFEISPYFIAGTAAAGLKLRLVGVQIIDLVSSGHRSADSLGFDEEDGYTHTETAERASAEADADDVSAAVDDGSDDF